MTQCKWEKKSKLIDQNVYTLIHKYRNCCELAKKTNLLKRALLNLQYEKCAILIQINLY